jgi:hypothetical protein
VQQQYRAQRQGEAGNLAAEAVDDTAEPEAPEVWRARGEVAQISKDGWAVLV